MALAPVASAGPVALVPVLVAARPLPAGTLLQDQDLTTADLAVSGLPPDYVAWNSPQKARLPGQLVVHAIAAGAPIVPADIQPAATQTSALLAPGMRAIAIAVNSQTSVAGLLTRGDFVDVLLSYKMDDGSDASRTILQNVRVVATDQDITETGKPGTSVPKTVTLEVSPAGAKVIALAGQIGTLSLALSPAPRAGAGSEIVLDDAPITTHDLTSVGMQRPAPETVAVAQKPTIVVPDVQIFRGSGIARSDAVGGAGFPGMKAGN